MKRVIVASKNPVKINAVKFGFEKMFPDGEFKFEGLSVPSGVSDQPMTNQETYNGALNRSNNAKDELRNADYWVGVEGGLDVFNDEMEIFAWIVVQSKDRIGKSRTSSFFLPPKVEELVKGGMELGDADDIVFKDNNSKQKGGAVGILTDNVMTRTSYYSEAVILALVSFKHEGIYTKS